MGKKDITLNEFLGDPHIFADLLNGCFFRGRQEIRPEELLPMDSVQGTESRSGKKDSGYKEAVLQTPPGRSAGRRKPGEPGLPDACTLYAL